MSRSPLVPCKHFQYFTHCSQLPDDSCVSGMEMTSVLGFRGSYLIFAAFLLRGWMEFESAQVLRNQKLSKLVFSAQNVQRLLVFSPFLFGMFLIGMSVLYPWALMHLQSNYQQLSQCLLALLTEGDGVFWWAKCDLRWCFNGFRILLNLSTVRPSCLVVSSVKSDLIRSEVENLHACLFSLCICLVN